VKKWRRLHFNRDGELDITEQSIQRLKIRSGVGGEDEVRKGFGLKRDGKGKEKR
jgi:hypothetical protein